MRSHAIESEQVRLICHHDVSQCFICKFNKYSKSWFFVHETGGGNGGVGIVGECKNDRLQRGMKIARVRFIPQVSKVPGGDHCACSDRSFQNH